MWKDSPDGQTSSCSACEAKAHHSKTSLKHVCGKIEAQCLRCGKPFDLYGDTHVCGKEEVTTQNWEELARNLHEWYLEATKSLHPESYNPNAQKSYDDLTEEQREIDRYIAGKFMELLSQKGKEVVEATEEMRLIPPLVKHNELIDEFQAILSRILNLSDNK